MIPLSKPTYDTDAIWACIDGSGGLAHAMFLTNWIDQPILVLGVLAEVLCIKSYEEM